MWCITMHAAGLHIVIQVSVSIFFIFHKFSVICWLCIVYHKLVVDFAVILVLFCPDLDSFIVLVSEGLPVQLIFSADDHGIG